MSRIDRRSQIALRVSPRSGRAVVEIQRVGGGMTPKTIGEKPQHLLFALGVMGLDGDDKARCVVQKGVDAHRLLFTIDDNGRTVTDVAVPQRKRGFGLPAKPLRLIAHIKTGRAGKPLLAKQPSDRRGTDRVFIELPLANQGLQDQRNRGAGMSLSDITQKLFEFVVERASVTAIGAAFGLEGVEASVFVGVVPALERRKRIRALSLCSRRPK